MGSLVWTDLKIFIDTLEKKLSFFSFFFDVHRNLTRIISPAARSARGAMKDLEGSKMILAAAQFPTTNEPLHHHSKRVRNVILYRQTS